MRRSNVLNKYIYEMKNWNFSVRFSYVVHMSGQIKKFYRYIEIFFQNISASPAKYTFIASFYFESC